MQSADRFVARNHALKTLLAASYNLTPNAILGGPEWISSDHYDILAKTGGGTYRPSADEQMAMLRTLIDQRFDLKFHREPKVMSIYTLSIAKSGSKLKPGSVSEPLINVIYPDHVHLPGRKVTVTELASLLQRVVLDRPVVDKTGLPGTFDFDLEWTPDDSQFGGQLHPLTDSPKPGLFAALQEQLGLRLESTKGPVEVLVIDRVSRPSAN